MAVWTQQSDDDPLFRVQGHAVYITEFLIGLYGTFFVLTALSDYLHLGGFLAQLPLSTGEVLARGKIWQLLTYPLINPISIWFAVEMLMLYWFGREVERAMGRRGFVLFYLSLILCPAIVLLGISTATASPITYNSSQNLHFALFIAFAILFPEAPLYFGAVFAKWVAIVFVAILTLMYVAHHDWINLAVLWTGVAVSLIAIRVPFVSGFFEWFEERRERQRTAQIQKKIVEQKRIEDRRHQSIDPILEKISKQGMKSLTREERDLLERARLELLRRDRH